MFIYSYYNRKTGSYEDPFVQPIQKDLFPKMVCRSVVLNPEDARKSHRYECDLFYLGTWDEETCHFDLLDKPEFLVSLASLEVKNDA